MKEEIYKAIKDVEEAKKARKQIPSHVLQSEITVQCRMEDKRRLLNELFRERRIGYCRTLNQLAFYTKI